MKNEEWTSLCDKEKHILHSERSDHSSFFIFHSSFHSLPSFQIVGNVGHLGTMELGVANSVTLLTTVIV